MQRPNIVLLVLDAFRHDHLWRQTAQGPLCPQLADFAAAATSFENAISPAAMTGATHASLFTGRLPCDHGLHAVDDLLGRPLPGASLVSLLRRAGYRCIALSANPWIGRRTALGCDFDVLIDAADLRGATPWRRRLRALTRALGRSADRLIGRRTAPGGVDATGELAVVEKLVTAAAMTVRAARSAWPGAPVFLFCNLMPCHDPYLFTPADADLARPDGAPGRRVVPRAWQPDFWLDMLGVRRISDEMQARLRWAYAAAVHCADRLAGRLLAETAACLGEGETDFIVTADHGELLGEHGFYDHGLFLYEPLVHVPLLVRSTALPAGRRCEELVQTHWTWSWIARRAGLGGEVDRPAGQGELRAALEGGAPDAPAYSFGDARALERRYRVVLKAAARRGVRAEQLDPRPVDTHRQAVRRNGRVLVATRAGRRLAYRVSADGREELLEGDAHERTVAELGPLLLPMPEIGAAPTAGAVAADEDVLRRLRELGYAE